MDELDKAILTQLSENARTTVKQIAQKVSLTSPAVAERIRRMEKNGVIAGYTVRLGEGEQRAAVRAIISLYVPPGARQELEQLVKTRPEVEECYNVTGAQSHMVKVRCRDIEEMEQFISRLQKLGQTNTQIVLSAMQGPHAGLAF